MGRYYSGDIEGKFWFGVQSSVVPEDFGAVEDEPYYINYTIYREHLDQTHKRMAELEAILGDTKKKLDDFFEANNGYNDQKLIDAGIDPKYISPYADWFFGKKVLDFFEANPDADSCCFEAEV
jgi:hypothetical protein